MTKEEKIKLFNDFYTMFNNELLNIPCNELIVNDTIKAETIAECYFISQGYEVYKSKTNNGYRCIGVEFYWSEFSDKITKQDMILINKLKSFMSQEQLEILAMAIRQKNGTPDLLLIKENKISFVEVKCNYETIKPSTVEFFIKYNDLWPISVLRIINKR